MKNKFIATIGIIFLMVVAYVAFKSLLPNKPASPREKLKYESNGLTISVDYCRPSKRGRLIFGEESENALVPYKKYWRTGANEASEISFGQDVWFGGKELKKGRYVIYTIPDKKTWKVVLNSELGRWGYTPADRNLDILDVEVPAETTSEQVEMFTFAVEKIDENKATLVLLWDTVRVAVPIERKM